MLDSVAWLDNDNGNTTRKAATAKANSYFHRQTKWKQKSHKYQKSMTDVDN